MNAIHHFPCEQSLPHAVIVRVRGAGVGQPLDCSGLTGPDPLFLVPQARAGRTGTELVMTVSKTQWEIEAPCRRVLIPTGRWAEVTASGGIRGLANGQSVGAREAIVDQYSPNRWSKSQIKLVT